MRFYLQSPSSFVVLRHLIAAYLATLKWVEPFATGKPQDLRLEIHAWKDKSRKRTYLFFCASPQSSEAPIRKTLRKIRAAFVAK